MQQKVPRQGWPHTVNVHEACKCFTCLLYSGNPEVISYIFILALVLVWYLGPEVLGLLCLGKLPSFLEVPLKAFILVSSICSQYKSSASAGPLLAKGQKIPKQCNRLCFLLAPSLELGLSQGAAHALLPLSLDRRDCWVSGSWRQCRGTVQCTKQQASKQKTCCF